LEKLLIIKIGGKVVEDKSGLPVFLHNFASIPGKKILVHGGGKSVSEMSRKLGIEVKMVEGRRITDSDTLDVVKMMLAGVANKNVVSLLQGKGCNAIGLTGADGNMIRAHRRPLTNGIDYGFVGDIDEVNTSDLKKLIKGDFIPVLTAMTHDGKGQLLNTNADTIAQSIGVGMAFDYDVEIFYCFEKPGVLAEIDKDLAGLEAKQSVFRIYRDVRFSHDKSPYKINMGAAMTKGGRKSPFATYYVHIEPGNSFAGGGIWMPTGPVLKAMRQEVYYNADEFKNLIGSRGFTKYFNQLMGDKLKRPPRDFPADFPDVELLKYKSYVVGNNMDDGLVSSDALMDKLLDVYKALYPFNSFINRALSDF